jgi:predicted dithiol-disulfide oxidoreductase (DUF899 family)
MCPACIASATAVFASAISITGLAAVAATLARALGWRASNRLTFQERTMQEPRIVSRDEWLTARRQLLVKEKAHTRAQDALSAERRQLPMVRVEKDYVFDTPEGRRTLAELFDNRSQLIVYHFMMGPDWAEGCPSCSLLADHNDASTVHLAQRDVTLLAVSRAPLPNIESFKRRMGWHLPWASSFGSDFNRDYHVSFTREELESGPVYNFGTGGFPTDEAPGVSVFYRNGAGEVFHTYSAYARGGEPLIGVYHYLDLVPKGRDEGGLVFPMAWVRHHDRYAGALPAASETYVPPAGAVFVAPRPRAAACCEGHES